MTNQQIFIENYNNQATNIKNYKTWIEENINEFNNFINLIRINKSQNFYITGIGKNDPIAEKTANMMRSLGINAHKLNCVHAMHGDMGMLKDGDIIICLSKSGNTSELINFLQYARNIFDLTIIGINSSERSKFDQLCCEVYTIPVVELDKYDKVPTNSNILYQMFLDNIIMTALHDSFTLERFVETHPGGDIGKTNVSLY